MGAEQELQLTFSLPSTIPWTRRNAEISGGKQKREKKKKKGLWSLHHLGEQEEEQLICNTHQWPPAHPHLATKQNKNQKPFHALSCHRFAPTRARACSSLPLPGHAPFLPVYSWPCPCSRELQSCTALLPLSTPIPAFRQCLLASWIFCSWRCREGRAETGFYFPALRRKDGGKRRGFAVLEEGAEEKTRLEISSWQPFSRRVIRIYFQLYTRISRLQYS